MKTLGLVAVLVIAPLGACADTDRQERIARTIAAANDSSTAAGAAVNALDVAFRAVSEAVVGGASSLSGPESAEEARTALLNASAAAERAFELGAAVVDALSAVDAGTAANTAAVEALDAANDAHSLTQSLVSIWNQVIQLHEAKERSFEEAMAGPDPDLEAGINALQRGGDLVGARLRTFAEGMTDVVPAVQRAKERAEATARYLSARFEEDTAR